MSATFDTLKFTETLQAAGVPEKQAKAEAISDAFGQTLDTQIATKADIYSVKAEQRLMKWMLGFNLILSFAMLLMIASMLLSN